MDAKLRRRVLRQTLSLTIFVIIGSVAITCLIMYLARGHVEPVAILIAILAPGLLAPISSYFHISMGARLRQANDRLRVLSETDPLTGIFNRRRFLDVADGQLALARRHCFPTSVLLIDFDRFKAINDEFGHLAGDRVLVEASRVIGTTLRESDTLARFGGEEFICLLPHTAREGALMVAQRIIEAMREHTFRHGDADIQVTVSIGGVSCGTSETSLERMTSMADSLMYEAKQSGRNRYMIEGLPRQSALPFREARESPP